MSKIAVVTGASSGLGREFAVQISKKYKTIEEIWVIARRKEWLDDLKKVIKNKKVVVLALDITKEEDLDIYRNKLKEENPTIRVLVNAAGYGMMGYFETTVYEDQVGMIDTNCRALVAMTHISLPYMGAPSNIINIASAAAYMPQPSFAVYAATKSMVRSFSKALNAELEGKDILVTAVCPGPVNTEFFDIAEQHTKTKAFKMFFRVEAKDVVSRALYDVYYMRNESTYSIPMKLCKVGAKLVPHDLLINFFK